MARMKCYELEGVAFGVMDYSARDQVLNEFASMISSAREGVIYGRTRPDRVKYGGYAFEVNRLEYFLCTRTEGLAFGREAELKRPKAKAQIGLRALLLENGKLARVFTAYSFPTKLYEGFLYTVMGAADEIALRFRVIPKHRAMGIIESARRRKAFATEIKEMNVYEALTLMGQRIASGAEMLEYYIFFTVMADEWKDLERKSSELRTALEYHGVRIDAPPIQRDLYNWEPGAGIAAVSKKYTDTEAIKPFFFLIDEELHDEDGVFIGVSGTGAPVIYDAWTKPNLNLVILGVTGAGKSMTAKVYMKRLVEHYADKGRILPIIGIDPESEYTRVAEHFMAAPVEIDLEEAEERGGLGLDPIKLMREGLMDIAQVADILSELYAIPHELQGSLRKELFYTEGRGIDSMERFVNELEQRNRDLARYLEGALAPPDSIVYNGEPPDLSGSTIFGLKKVTSSWLKILISALISVYAYNKAFTKQLAWGEEGKTAERSVFFVDEAWLFMNTPSIVGLFENIARRGRKYRLHFIYISQRAEDLAKTPQGRTILEQAASAIILRQEPEGKDVVKEIYKLSDPEAEMLVNAPPGTGIFKAGGKRMMLRVLPTPEEMKIFTTR